MTNDRPTAGQLIVEGLATMVLMLFGLGGAVQVGTAADGAMGDHGDMAWAWGIGVMVAVYVGAKVSGAHLNPAVTIALAAFHRFAWRKVPGYVAAQCVGAFVGAAVVVVAYRDLLRGFDPGKTIASQALLVTLPGNGIAPVSVASAFLDQVIGTAILLLAIFALITAANDPPLSNLEPYVVGIVVVGIDMAWGALAGAPINPARDVAPRLVLALAGYDTAWSDHTGYPYWWVPIVAPLLGGLLGAAVFHHGVARFLPTSGSASSGSRTGSSGAAAPASAPLTPAVTQVAALATSFAIDFLTWDEDDPHARGAELAKYFPTSSPEALTRFGGWSGRGRQEVVEPLFSPAVTPSPDGRTFHVTPAGQRRHLPARTGRPRTGSCPASTRHR